MRQLFLYSLALSMFIFLLGCNGEPQNTHKPKPEDYKEPLMEANRHVVKTENQHIEDFLRRYKWDMEESGSGLRYKIYPDGKGKKAETGLLATISYKIRAITGDVIYTSEEKGLLSFIIGNGEVISGLEEGILYMNVGDKAKFIIPSHLAYGLVGDANLIPGKSTLIYDIELLSLKQ